MTTLFVSDLHLDPSRPDITALFLRLLETEALQAEAVYVLGDLFEAWLGDDDHSEPGECVAAALRQVSDAGIPVYLMRGNRDFLLGPGFAERAGACLLPDPCVIDLHGQPTLLMHGDLLCTDDHHYLAFRRQVRSADWQQAFLAQPLPQRQAFAAQARAASQAHQSGLATAGTLETITDVNAVAVAEVLGRYGVQRLIHGHTHRPGIHRVNVGCAPADSVQAGERCATRVVLGDWYSHGSVLRASRDGLALSGYPTR